MEVNVIDPESSVFYVQEIVPRARTLRDETHRLFVIRQSGEQFERVAGRKVVSVSDPLDSVIDDVLAAVEFPGAIHPGLAQQVAQHLRRLRSAPVARVGAVDGAALCEPYLRGFPIDGVAISTLGSSFGGDTIAASDSTAARLDEIQLDLGQGPCWDAITADALVSVIDTSTEERWPLFSDAVTSIDIRAVFAFPLVFEGLSIGVVDVYSRTPGPLSTALVTDLTAASAATSLRVLTAVLGDDENEHSSTAEVRRRLARQIVRGQ